MSYKNDSLLYTISDDISLYRESSMTARDADKPGTAAATREKKPGCFLCVLDPHPCTEMQLEGRIVAAREYITNGEKTPVITLDCGTFVVSLALTRYYRSLVKELAAVGSAIRNLTLRVYHLPGTPVIAEYKGRPLRRYQANSYTLVVLEPDTLLNITDLNQAEYCPRQYLLRRLAPSPAWAAAIRGNLVHACFKELLKEHDRGELMEGRPAGSQETPLAALHRYLEQSLARSSLELALAHVSAGALRAEVAPHLDSLATWYQHQSSSLWDMPAAQLDDRSEGAEKQRSENLVRAETFLLAPEIGLKGRLDLLWQQSGRQRLLELKTGGSKGALPRSEHRWQVHGYNALLTVRRDSRMKKAPATLLYTGTPVEAQAFSVPFTVRDLQLVNETRNILVLSHVTGIAPAPPGPSRCTKCSMLNQCEQVSTLLDWLPPQPDESAKAQVSHMPAPGNGHAPLQPAVDAGDREFFATYYRLLQLEGRAGEQQQALLWKTSLPERVERGTAISNLRLLGKAEPTGQGEWLQTFGCVNNSELREGEEILLSDGDPVTGEVVTGTIVSISAEQVKVWTPELIAHPTLIDRYSTDIVHVRTAQNLLRWLQATPHMRALVAGKRQPRFNMLTVTPRSNFNIEQNLAVARAIQMQDYLLIHGPPGTGKTSVIAEIVKRLCLQGQRVMLAAFTNQAVDNMLKRLDTEGFHDYVRLGHDRSVDNDVQKRLLKTLALQSQGDGAAQDSPAAALSEQELRVDEILRQAPVVASTTATWSSEKYTPPSLNEIESHYEASPLHFDVAIIDEAGQLTVPAILGALRFAKRFILVGDEKQLPPLVLSQEASDAGLSESLFSKLKLKDYGYTKDGVQSESSCVSLKVQYRMNKWISHFASKVFYDGQLIPHASVANNLVDVVPSKISRRPEKASIVRAIDPKAPMVFLDVFGNQERAKTSDAEALAVRDVVAGLLARGIAQQEIGIIAPYRAQVANLRRYLSSDDETIGWEALSYDTQLSVDTVDRFQGGERPVIIMSFATTTRPEVNSQLRDHLTNPNRLNVALTRAQKKLILVGNASALESLPVFERLLAYCRGLNTIIPYDYQQSNLQQG